MTILTRLIGLYRERRFLGTVRQVINILQARLQTAIFYASKPPPAEVVTTGGSAELDTFSIESANRQFGGRYVSTPHLVLTWVHKLLPGRLEEWTFVDYGAGTGRVVIDAARWPYKQIVGVEFARELAKIAKQNVASQPRCRIVYGDAVDYEIPDGPCVFYMFAPFKGPVFKQVISNIIKSYQRDRRAMVLAYLNPTQHEVLDTLGEFKLCRWPLRLLWTIKLLNPHEIRVYATDEAFRLMPTN